MAKEPKPKNIYKCSPKLWRGLSDEERLFYNKFYAFIYYTKEFFDTKEVMGDEEWTKLCRRMSIAGTHCMRKTRQSDINRQYRNG